MNARRLRFLSPALALAMGLWLAVPAEAYRLIQNTSTGRVTSGSLVTCSASGGFAHWTTPGISWRLNTAGQGSGKATALQSALSSWSGAGTPHNLSYGGTTSSTWSTDGVNAVYWGTGNGCNTGCLAITALVLQSGQEIVESDIMFNSNYTWNTNGSMYDTEAVAAHELGHSLGIHHTELTSSPTPTMNANYFGTGGRSLETDDRAALQCSADRYCLAGELDGSGTYFAGRSMASLSWSCVDGANVDVFRDGVKVATTANDGAYTDIYYGYLGSANFWVCEAGSTTWYDSSTCTNVKTITYPY